MNRSREEKVAIIMAKHIVDKHNCNCKPIKMNGDGYLYLYNKEFDLLITVCDTNEKKCIKIEEILINEKYRNKGVCTRLINTIKGISDEYNVTVGLWCRLNDHRLFDFYTRLGFIHTETLRDYWLEYN